MDFNLRQIKVKTWYLQFTANANKLLISKDVQLWKRPNPEKYLELYTEVGKEWGWTGRLVLSTEELQEKLSSPENEVWLFKEGKEIFGFFEIDYAETGKAEIVYLGLLPQFIGKGKGKLLLNTAIITAAQGNNSVWLHTCEHDYEGALAFYQKCGFEIISESIDEEYYSTEFLNRRGIKY